jgi:hypothetical protein
MSPDIDLAESDAKELIRLIKYYALEQTEDYLFPCGLVDSELWTEEVHKAYWGKYWDGDLDRLGWTVVACFDYFYPL